MATLLGLDFGSTTSSAMIAAVQLLRNAITGRMELTNVREIFRSELVLTPLIGESLDEAAITLLIDRWLREGNVRVQDVVGGGALLTGLTAHRQNAEKIVRIIRGRIGNALVATADDPCLESWLAFLGSCASLSRRHPETLFLHMDIGGGTTNVAFGTNGEVQSTGCLMVGARHIRVAPGSYRILGLSQLATQLLTNLQIRKQVGEVLEASEVDAIIQFQIGLLEAIFCDDFAAFENPLARSHVQVLPQRQFTASIPGGHPPRRPVVTLSGGVGELVYRRLSGAPTPGTTAFGDLGIDLANALANHPQWQADLRDYVPEAGGRATVSGLLRHTTQLSGNTLHLIDPQILPLNDVPIIGSVTPDTTDEALRNMLELAMRCRSGAALRVDLLEPSVECVRNEGERIGRVLADLDFPGSLPLVLLLRQNAGKTLGQYVTHWGNRPFQLLVVDEIDRREARFVHLGMLHDNTIPVSFFGLPS